MYYNKSFFLELLDLGIEVSNKIHAANGASQFLIDLFHQELQPYIILYFTKRCHFLRAVTLQHELQRVEGDQSFVVFGQIFEHLLQVHFLLSYCLPHHFEQVFLVQQRFEELLQDWSSHRRKYLGISGVNTGWIGRESSRIFSQKESGWNILEKLLNFMLECLL